jgi:hypothetical protein
MVYSQFLDSSSSSLAINRSDTALAYPHPQKTCFSLERNQVFTPCNSRDIPPHSVRLWIDKREIPPNTKIRSEISVSSCTPDQDLRIVGSTSQIGGWNPQKGLRLMERNGVCTASLLLNRYAVLRFKVVEVQEKKIQWGKGSDLILWNNDTMNITWTP